MIDVISNLFTSGVIIAGVIFLSKLMFNHLDKRALESFKLQVQNETKHLEIIRERAWLLNNERCKEIGRWSNTLLSAVNGLIGRLEFIKKGNFKADDDYIHFSTMYYISHFLGWGQIFREERDMSIQSPANDEIMIYSLMKNVSISIRQNDYNHAVIRSLEQSYIADKMTSNKKCISYATFIDDATLCNYKPLHDFSRSLINISEPKLIDDILSHLKSLKSHMEKLLKEVAI